MWLLLGIIRLDVIGPSCVTMMVESTLCKLVAVGCIYSVHGTMLVLFCAEIGKKSIFHSFNPKTSKLQQ